MKRIYFQPEVSVIVPLDNLLQQIQGSQDNNQGSGNGEGEGGSFAPANPGWLDSSDRFYGNEE